MKANYQEVDSYHGFGNPNRANHTDAFVGVSFFNIDGRHHQGDDRVDDCRGLHW